VRPQNVREGMPGAEEPPEIDVDDRVLDVDGEAWTVRAEGRARVGRGRSPAHLIQLVFRSDDGTEREAEWPDTRSRRMLRRRRRFDGRLVVGEHVRVA